ncbi:MAG: MEDS domain-containing protein [Planctomycetes bacterium]|nr:MEDS domain-containing protein [Planctomycetota bacterium]
MNSPSHRPSRSVNVSGRALTPPRHICCFFDSRNQQYETLVPYVLDGLANGEKVLMVMDSEFLDDHHARLRSGGVAVDAAQANGHLCSHCTDTTYLAGGSFEKARMYRMLEEELQSLPARSFTSLRTFGDMNWALRDMEGIDEIMDYEMTVNDLLAKHDATFMCGYDANRISGHTMLDILATHSHVLMGTVVHENPYYVPPEEYRRSLMARRANTSAVVDKDRLPWSKLFTKTV